MNKFNYKNLCPFKWFVLQNFPFIEADFDAITNWQLFCKLGEEMNKIIEKVNQAGEQTENLTNAFIELQNYVNNYFENLDVQDEINIKLNEMAEDGTLENIINQEIFTDLNNRINNLQDEINDIKTDKKTMIVIGDSFSNSAQSGTPLWYTYVSNALNLNVYTNSSDGQGYGTGTNNFLKQLETANNYFTDKSIIDRIYIVGGLNDLGNTAGIPTDNDFRILINQVLNYAVSNFPNIPVYVYGILPFQFYNFYGGDNYLPSGRATAFTEMLSYTALLYPNVFFTNCSSFGLFSPDYFGEANNYNQMHPSAIGEKAIANLILTNQRFFGIRNINNDNQSPTLGTEIPIVRGIATSVEIIGTDLNNIYVRVNGYQNTEYLELNINNLPIEFNTATVQYDFPVTDELTTIYAYGSANSNLIIQPNILRNGNIYINIPYNPLW